MQNTEKVKGMNRIIDQLEELVQTRLRKRREQLRKQIKRNVDVLIQEITGK